MSERPSSNFVFQEQYANDFNKETQMLTISKQEYTAGFKKQAVKPVTAVWPFSMR